MNQQQRMNMNQQINNAASHNQNPNVPSPQQMSQQQMHQMQQHQRMLNHQRMMMMNAAHHNNSHSQLMRPSGPNMRMNMGHPGGPMYGMNNNNSQRRPAPYPNPMYMQTKRLQQPGMFPSSGTSGMNMAGQGGCGPGGNMPSNGFTGGMRSGSS